MRIFKKLVTYLSVVALTVATCTTPFSNMTVSAEQAKSINHLSNQPKRTVINPEEFASSQENIDADDIPNSESPDSDTADTGTESSVTDEPDESSDSSELEDPDVTTEEPSELPGPDSLEPELPQKSVFENEVSAITTYDELYEAIEYADPGDTIVLNQDIDFGSNSPIRIYKSITLHADSTVTLTAAENRHFSILPRDRNPVVTFENVILDGGNSGGGIVIENLPAQSPPLVPAKFSPAQASYPGGSVEINKPVILNCAADSGGAIELVTPVNSNLMYSVSVKNAEIKNNTAQKGGGIYIGHSNSLTVENSEIKINTAIAQGGGIYADSNEGQTSEIPVIPASVQLQGNVQIEGNTASSNGGGIFADVYVPLIFDGTGIKIEGNTSGSSGGGIYFSGGLEHWNVSEPDPNETVHLDLTGLTFHNNTADQQGGGLYIGKHYNTAVINNCTFSENEAWSGGAIYSDSSEIFHYENEDTDPTILYQTLTIDNSRIFANKASDGGGVYAVGHLVSSNSFYYNNTAYIKGGAMIVGQSFNLDQCQIYKNDSSGEGGAIYSQNNTADITDKINNSKITKNTSRGNGGALCINNYYGSGNNLEISGSEISYNISENPGQLGGGIYLHAGDLTITNSEIIENSADTGGGINHDSTGNILIKDTHMTGNTARGSYGGGISILAYSQYIDDENGGTIEVPCTYHFENCLMNENKAMDGGAIALMAFNKETAPQLSTEKVTFKDNRADKGFHSDLVADGFDQIHEANIRNTTYTALFENAYNNYDIIYDKEGDNGGGGGGVNYVAVIYHGNGNTSGTAPASQSVTITETTINNVTLSGSGTLAKSGYRFSSWNTKADGTGTSYSPGSSIPVPEDIHLYAIWRESGGPGPGTTATDEPGGSTVEPSGTTEEPLVPTEDLGSTEDTEDFTYGPDGSGSNESGSGSGNQSSDSSTPSRTNWWKRNPKTGANANPALFTGELLLALSAFYLCVKASQKKEHD